MIKSLDLDDLEVQQLRDLNEIFGTLKQKFNDLSEEILKIDQSSLACQLHPVTGRNPYESSLLLQLSYLILAKTYLKTEGSIQSLTVQNPTQKKILKRYLKKTSINCKIRAKWRVREYIHLLYGVYTVIQRSFLYSRSKDLSRINTFRNQKKIILLDTFILQNSLTAGRFIDRYYPSIRQFISSSVKDRLVLYPTILGKFKGKQLNTISKNSEEKILFKQDFLRISDYLRAIKKMVSLSFKIDHPFMFEGLDVTPLVKRQFLIGKVSKSAFEGILNFMAIQRMSEWSIDLGLVIDWNENQAIDKGLVKGVKTFYPGIPTKGYQGYIISTDYNLYIQPTDYEIRADVIPDEIHVIGKALENRIKENSHNLKVNTSPAFRFNNVYREYPLTEVDRKSLLVILPIGLAECCDIITLLAKASLSMDMSSFQILIKPHPLVNVGRLKRECGPHWLAYFTIVEGDFNEIVSQCDLVVGSASSTLMETIVRGIPVIIIGSQKGLTQNPIPAEISKRLWSLCYTEVELSRAIRSFMARSPEDQSADREYAKEIRSEYFEIIGSKLELLEEVIK